MRVVFRMSAIVAALAILAGGALAGCGQRGALYLPTVPPLPAKPNERTEPPGEDVKPGDETASSAASGKSAGEVPDTSGTALTLSPDTELNTAPAAPSRAASDAAQTQ
ncbi:LPS translocon maturation chaperone LptM [Paraburkholderia kururiensis]|uniref:Lipoprotein n=1 Tax=Paraburkholderia kururiensis TaxID=984307 RepID=A0ABZ0WF37_9BURK|nr:lipoprotein [Paraburkholderia kururiensis]WQD75948.1 lipoprotein [Paraburkholderia kururiensis]